MVRLFLTVGSHQVVIVRLVLTVGTHQGVMVRLFLTVGSHQGVMVRLFLTVRPQTIKLVFAASPLNRTVLESHSKDWLAWIHNRVSECSDLSTH